MSIAGQETCQAAGYRNHISMQCGRPVWPSPCSLLSNTFDGHALLPPSVAAAFDISPIYTKPMHNYDNPGRWCPEASYSTAVSQTSDSSRFSAPAAQYSEPTSYQQFPSQPGMFPSANPQHASPFAVTSSMPAFGISMQQQQQQQQQPQQAQLHHQASMQQHPQVPNVCPSMQPVPAIAPLVAAPMPAVPQPSCSNTSCAQGGMPYSFHPTQPYPAALFYGHCYMDPHPCMYGIPPHPMLYPPNYSSPGPPMSHHVMLPAPAQQSAPMQSQAAMTCHHMAPDNCGHSAKKPRMVWTNDLHMQFETALKKLGTKAVPKDIMQEMGITGLTRQNVASHLQKYRLRKAHSTSSSNSKQHKQSCAAGSAGTATSNMKHTSCTSQHAQDAPVQHAKDPQGTHKGMVASAAPAPAPAPEPASTTPAAALVLPAVPVLAPPPVSPEATAAAAAAAGAAAAAAAEAETPQSPLPMSMSEGLLNMVGPGAEVADQDEIMLMQMLAWSSDG